MNLGTITKLLLCSDKTKQRSIAVRQFRHCARTFIQCARILRHGAQTGHTIVVMLFSMLMCADKTDHSCNATQHAIVLKTDQMTESECQLQWLLTNNRGLQVHNGTPRDKLASASLLKEGAETIIPSESRVVVHQPIGLYACRTDQCQVQVSVRCRPVLGTDQCQVQVCVRYRPVLGPFLLVRQSSRSNCALLLNINLN